MSRFAEYRRKLRAAKDAEQERALLYTLGAEVWDFSDLDIGCQIVELLGRRFHDEST